MEHSSQVKSTPTPTFSDLVLNRESGHSERYGGSNHHTSVSTSISGTKVFKTTNTTVFPSNMNEKPKQDLSLATDTSKFSGTLPIILGALLGVGLGLGLTQLNPSEDVSAWIALPGDLFIRALKLLVVPMIFTSLTVAIADILMVGKAYSIGWRVAALNIFTSVVASIEGVLIAMLFKSFFTGGDAEDVTSTEVLASFKCGNGLYLTAREDGTVACLPLDTVGNNSNFVVNDLNSLLIKKQEFTEVSFSQQLIEILKQAVPMNITQAFSEAALLSIVMFSIPFGIAVTRSHAGSPQTNNLLNIIRYINAVFLLLIRWIINLSPFAVVSLIAGSLAKNEDQLSLIKSVGSLIGVSIAGFAFHLFVMLPLLLFIFIRQNPFAYLRQMIPAQVFAFGCASSMATVPVTMRCVEMTREVTRNLTRFVIPIGATVNMDGSAIYYPIVVIFMAEASGQGDKIKLLELILLVIVSTLASIGGAPVPNAGLVVVVTVWQTIMSSDVPEVFSFVVAMDWLLDRMLTATNITGDTVIARIIADQVDERYESEC